MTYCIASSRLCLQAGVYMSRQSSYFPLGERAIGLGHTWEHVRVKVSYPLDDIHVPKEEFKRGEELWDTI